MRCVQAANATLGESPLWDPVAACLYWVDIKRPAVYRYEPAKGQTGVWPLPQAVGCVGLAGLGRLVVADAAGIAWLDLRSGVLDRIADPEPELSLNRFNDGKVDRAGRFWAGTVYDHSPRPVGSLYRIDTDSGITRIASGFTCPNGIGWSPDNRTMYFTDSLLRTIWAYEYDLATGDLGARRIFAQLAESDGLPDGLTVDSEGYVWSAVWGGWRVIRYAPDGVIERVVSMPVQNPSSCMFGGPDLQTLYVTSANIALNSCELQAGPLAGGLFAIETGVIGVEERLFGKIS